MVRMFAIALAALLLVTSCAAAVRSSASSHDLSDYQVTKGRVMLRDAGFVSSGSWRIITDTHYVPNTVTQISVTVDDWTTSSPRDWQGIDVWSRYQSQYDLYVAQLLRPDRQVTIAKKVHTPGNSRNNYGDYTTLGAVDFDWQLGETYDFSLETETIEGDVRFVLREGERTLLVAWDRSADKHLSGGRSGWRGDGVAATVSAFRVQSVR